MVKGKDKLKNTNGSMDNLLGISFGFWPPKPVMITNTPGPIVEVVLRTNVKKRVLKPFSELKERQKRKRLAHSMHFFVRIMSQHF